MAINMAVDVVVTVNVDKDVAMEVSVDTEIYITPTRSHFKEKKEDRSSSKLQNLCSIHIQVGGVQRALNEDGHALFGHTGGVRFSRPSKFTIFYI